MPSSLHNNGTALISVVVPTIDAGEMLEKAIGSVVEELPEGVEIILFDNGSTDGSVEKAAARFRQVKALKSPINTGFAQACNEAAKEASGTYLLFLNTDARVTPGCLRRLLREAEADSATAIWQPLIVGNDGKSVDSAGDSFTWTGYFWHHLHPPRDSGPARIFSAKGACMLIRRDVFGELGGFRSSYFAYFEESDLCWRARMRKWEVRLIPDVVVEHIGGATTRRILPSRTIYYLSYRNRLRSICANASRGSLFRILPVHLFLGLGVALLFAVRGRLKVGIAILQAMIQPFIEFRSTLQERRQSQEARLASDGEIFDKELVVSLSLRRARTLLAGHLRRW